MKKLMIAAAAMALIGSASAATVMTDSQMDTVTAGGRSQTAQSLAIALGGSSASASGGTTNVAAAAHLNYVKTTPTSAYAASGGIAVSYSQGTTRRRHGS